MRRVLAAALLGVSAPALAGEKPLYQPAPAWVVPAPSIDPAKLGDDTPLFVVVDTQDRLADGTVWTYRDIATRMASPDVVAQAGTINIEWAPAKGDLIVHKVEIIRGGQRIDALAGGKQFMVIRREQQLEKLAIDGQLTATLAVEGLQVGDILRAAVTLSRREDALGGAVQDILQVPAHPARVGFARTRLLWPAALPLQHRVAAEGLQPSLATLGAERELVITGVAPKAADLPEDAPLRYRKPPIVEASSFADWAAVSKVMAPFYVTDDAIKPGGALAGEVAAIAKAGTDPLRRADAALQLVQGKVRYLFNGLDKGNYVPQSAEQTWAVRYGDCKAKTVLLLAVLRALGVQAEAVLASATGGDAVPQRLPSAAAFDHVLVRATIGGTDYWLDGTGAGARLADLGDVPPFRWVLPLRAEGAALLAVPAKAPARAQMNVAIELDQRAGLGFPTLVHATATVRGPLAEMVGLAKTQGSKEQKAQLAGQMVGQMLGRDVALSSYTLTYDPAAAVATVDATGLASQVWVRKDGRYRLTLDRTIDTMQFEPDRARPAWRDIPVATGAPQAYDVSWRVRLPAGMTGFALDGDATLSDTLGGTRITRNAALAGDLVTATESDRRDGAEIAAADLPAARARVQLAKQRLLSVVAPADQAPRAAAVLAGRRDGRFKPLLAAYTAAIAAEPDEAQPYDNRAAFLLGIYDWAGAMPDLDKAVALSPDVGRYLRRASVAQIVGADAKALADLQAAQRLEPGSPVIVDALGSYLVDHGRKDEALALVQQQIDAGGSGKADMLSRKATLQARARDRDGALATIDQAVAIKPGTPDLLNNRCWLKAQMNVQLDTALKDCTKAIELSDAPAAVLDSRALAYFRLGRLDDALADLNAALEQAPSLSASLYLRGIVLKKQGKTAEGARDLEAALLMSPRVAEEYTPFGITPSS